MISDEDVAIQVENRTPQTPVFGELSKWNISSRRASSWTRQKAVCLPTGRGRTRVGQNAASFLIRWMR